MTDLRLGEGIHDIPDRDYLDDPAPEPSLNNSIAKVLVECSPRHAYAVHPRLGGVAGEDDDATEEMDAGKAAHAMFLRGEDAIEVIPFPSYQTKEAKRLRDEARAAGKIPLKLAKYESVVRIVNALEVFRQRTGAFTRGKPEQTLIWRESEGFWCRAKVDWLPDDPGAPLWDLKSTGGRATPRSWGRIAFDTGADMQAVHYARGAEIVRGEPPAGMCFVVVEQKPPHGIRVFRMTEAAREIGEAKCAEARERWFESVRTGRWSQYPDEIVDIEPPAWERMAWEYRTATGRGLRQVNERREADTAMLLQAGHFGG